MKIDQHIFVVQTLFRSIPTYNTVHVQSLKRAANLVFIYTYISYILPGFVLFTAPQYTFKLQHYKLIKLIIGVG